MDDILESKLFEAIEGDETDSDYLAKIAVAAASALVGGIFNEENKCNSDSEYYREEGNKAYKNGFLQKALVNYNKALAFAPNGSLSLKLAYSNRSAVLFSAKEYVACEIDCTTAIGINCPTPGNITEKLRKRKLQALVEHKKFNLAFCKDVSAKNFAIKHFKLKSQNIEIPCASADVGIIRESQIPKVIAQKDIPAGTVVALEKAFLTWSPDDPDRYMSCYYCRKLELNLFPCSGCVVAMFCSKQCEETCLSEYHSVECQIVGTLTNIKTDMKWLIKAVIKLRNMCSSWEEFILLSQDYGYNRLKKNTINEIFDVNSPSAVLSFRTDRHFLHGALFKVGLVSGTFLLIFRNLKSFTPQDWSEKMSAEMGMARVLMYLGLYGSTNILPLVTNIVDNNSIGHYNRGHRGVYAFVGKLKHSCVPNLQTIAVNSSMLLIAIEPIKAGTELTVSHVFHWLENDIPKNCRKINLFVDRCTVCSCFVCNATTNEWANMKEESLRKMSAAQKRAVVDCFTLEQSRMFSIPLDKCFEQIYKAITCLKDIPFSDHYEKVYKQLLRFQIFAIQNMVENVILSQDV